MKKLIEKWKATLAKLKNAWATYKAELAMIDWADVTVRATKTFVQVAVTYAVTALTGVNFSKELGGTFWLGFWLSAGSAGVSAAWNSVLMPVLDQGKAKAGLDAYAMKLAIEKAKASSDAHPEKDEGGLKARLGAEIAEWRSYDAAAGSEAAEDDWNG